MSSLHIRDLIKEYPTAAGGLRILNELTLTLQAGEQLAVLGPSGCGKSTLLHIAGTLDEPTSGTVELNGTNPFALRPEELAAFRNRHIGFIFQEHFLLPQLSALENVLLPVLAQRRITAEDKKKGLYLLEQVELLPRANHRPGELSGGERQRVAVARALMCQPLLLLADEPTGSLDEANAARVGQLLIQVARQSGAMLMCVTHSEALASHFPRRVQLTGGKLSDARLSPHL